MINKLEAKSKATSHDSKVLIDYIYDSIGSCKTCAFLGDRGVHCGQHNRTVPNNGYCWLYEKEIR